MGKNRILRITEGTVTGLHADFLAGLGRARVDRASEVEFCEAIGKWIVEIKIGPLANACLLPPFERRADALAAEVAILNEQHALGLLEGKRTYGKKSHGQAAENPGGRDPV